MRHPACPDPLFARREFVVVPVLRHFKPEEQAPPFAEVCIVPLNACVRDTTPTSVYDGKA